MKGMSKAEKDDMDRFEAEADLDTIMRARRIEKDDARMKKVRKIAKGRMDAMSGLTRVDSVKK